MQKIITIQLGIIGVSWPIYPKTAGYTFFFSVYEMFIKVDDLLVSAIKQILGKLRDQGVYTVCFETTMEWTDIAEQELEVKKLQEH